MATIGKRIIFVDATDILAQEANAATATILPGMAMLQTATAVTPDTQADTVNAPLLVADYNALQANVGGVDNVDALYADGEVVYFRQLTPNMRANVRVSSGNNITRRGLPLARDGASTAGHLKIAAADDVVVATSDEIINVTADGLVRVRGV